MNPTESYSDLFYLPLLLMKTQWNYTVAGEEGNPVKFDQMTKGKNEGVENGFVYII